MISLPHRAAATRTIASDPLMATAAKAELRSEPPVGKGLRQDLTQVLIPATQ